MRRYPYHTVNVFSAERFGGNPLAVVLDAGSLSSGEMQALAAEFNFSETAFVLPPHDRGNTARVRIFNRTAEMPFAGHPNVGTALVLASRDNMTEGTLRFEEAAGLVEVHLETPTRGDERFARVMAPQPLSVGECIGADTIAACIGLDVTDVVLRCHRPTVVSVGVPFVIAEVAPGALSSSTPNEASFRAALAARPSLDGRFSLFIYYRSDNMIRARMFAPIAGTWEDPATGSAAAALAALLLSHSDARGLEYTVTQGVEMGRRSLLQVRSWREGADIRASVRGRCVHAARGEVQL